MSFSQIALNNGRPQPITCHAWNADQTLLAFCPNNNEIHIVKHNAGKFEEFEPKCILKEHDGVVTSLAWGHKYNRIISCSQDRNAFVWQQGSQQNQWTPMLVFLRINRAATHVKWSHNELKFAVATGQKLVCVCYFDEEQDFWVSKQSEAFESTITSVDWHPNDTLIAIGGTNNVIRMVCSAIKGVDKKPPIMFGAEKSPKPMHVIAAFPVGGWIHNVAFSPSGNQLAFATHDSSLGFITLPSDRVPDASDVTKVYIKGLALTRLLWLNEDSVIAGGHEPNPTTFHRSGGKWVLGKAIDTAETRSSGPQRRGSMMSNAFQKFEAQSGRGEATVAKKGVETLHQNAITDMCVMSRNGAEVTKISSVGLDGRLVIWDLQSVESKLGSLKL